VEVGNDGGGEGDSAVGGGQSVAGRSHSSLPFSGRSAYGGGG
jgi:hypothetical protein